MTVPIATTTVGLRLARVGAVSRGEAHPRFIFFALQRRAGIEGWSGALTRDVNVESRIKNCQ
jgi:hypothetical protein